MKRISFMTLCGIFALQAVASNNFVADKDVFPMLAGLCRTSVDEFCGSEESTASNNVFTTMALRDTVIDGRRYLDFGRQRFLREENNRILLYSGKTGEKNITLYDFNLNVGDCLPCIYTYFEGGQQIFTNRIISDLDPTAKADTLVVTGIETMTLLDGNTRKMWTFNNGMSYAEGLGTVGNSRFAGNFFALIVEVIPGCLLGEHVVCICRDGVLLYQMAAAEQERLGAHCMCKTDDETDIEETHISEPSSCTKVLYNGQICIRRAGKIYNMMGAEM